jgi:hypothetical protein
MREMTSQSGEYGAKDKQREGSGATDSVQCCQKPRTGLRRSMQLVWGIMVISVMGSAMGMGTNSRVSHEVRRQEDTYI